MKEENKTKNTSKTKILNRPDNENKNKMMRNNVEDNREGDGETREAKEQSRNPKPTIDTNDSICNSSTSANRNKTTITMEWRK